MKLNWQEHKSIDPFEAVAGVTKEYIVHYAEQNDATMGVVKHSVLESLEKAITLLEKNLCSDSTYFLIEWDVVYSTLTIVITDEKMENDAPHVVKCNMVGLDKIYGDIGDLPDDIWEGKVNEFAAHIKAWCRDFLATCDESAKRNLVTMFHSESRERTVRI